MYSPWISKDYVSKYGGQLKICADYSHFVNVSESHPSSAPLQDVFQRLNPYVYHTHARVGFEEGPQVNDPRAPEWKSHLDSMLDVWADIFRHAEKRGDKFVTVCSEHGPRMYQHTMPYTQEHLADNWQINNYIGHKVKEMFESGSWRKDTDNHTKNNINCNPNNFRMETSDQPAGRREKDTKTDHHVFTDAEVESYEKNGYIFRRNF